jgi:hypothetical protein
MLLWDCVFMHAVRRLACILGGIDCFMVEIFPPLAF